MPNWKSSHSVSQSVPAKGLRPWRELSFCLLPGDCWLIILRDFDWCLISKVTGWLIDWWTEWRATGEDIIAFQLHRSSPFIVWCDVCRCVWIKCDGRVQFPVVTFRRFRINIIVGGFEYFNVYFRDYKTSPPSAHTPYPSSRAVSGGLATKDRIACAIVTHYDDYWRAPNRASLHNDPSCALLAVVVVVKFNERIENSYLLESRF